jgi:hypothetical protein
LDDQGAGTVPLTHLKGRRGGRLILAASAADYDAHDGYNAMASSYRPAHYAL